MDPYGSALATLPVVLARFPLVSEVKVVDVGCGDGEWLKAAQDLDVGYTVGIDSRASECIAERPNAYFRADFREGFPESKLLQADLVLCLEVAEHLPHVIGEQLVGFLCSLAPLILFSAAQPGQGPYPPKGTPLNECGPWHINEQTPQYWALEFRRRGFHQRVLREIREDMRVDPWYRENMYLYERIG